MRFDRRTFVTGLTAALLAPRGARAATVTDSAGRSVPVPARVERVFPAGPPAAIMLYTLASQLLLGWTRPNRAEEREFLLPEIGSRPEVGRITGRGNTANLEAVLNLKPDLVLDVGYVTDTYVSLANRVQEQTGISYALLDGSFGATAGAYRLLGDLIGRRDDAARPARARDRIGRLDHGRDHRVPGAERGRRDPRRARHRLDRAGAGVEPRRHRHHRQGFRRQGLRRPGLGDGRGREGAARASVAPAAVRLGRLPAVGQSADRPLVAGEY